MNPSDEKLWATLIHIGGILFGFLPSLIGYLVLKDRGPFIRGRVLDLSKGAAHGLARTGRGVGMVVAVVQ